MRVLQTPVNSIMPIRKGMNGLLGLAIVGVMCWCGRLQVVVTGRDTGQSNLTLLLTDLQQLIRRFSGIRSV